MANVANFNHVYKFLRDGAVADGKHDFGHETGFEPMMHIDLIKRGLYNRGADYPTRPKNEDALLEGIFPGVNLASIKDTIKATVRRHNIAINGIIPYDYTVKILHNGDDYNVKSLISDRKLTLEHFREFFGSDVINFLIDASSIGIMELIASLKKGAGDTQLKINLLVNRESRNDPAGKITEFIKIDADVAEKLKTDVLIDRDTSDIRYKHNGIHLNKTDLQRDKFFSIYDFVLAPVMYQENTGGSVKTKFITTRMDILDADGTQVEPSVTDPKSECSIANCWKIISTAGSDREKAIAFLKKRGGDWFQGLSCLDIMRNYESTTTGRINPITGSITLITHDRVLLAYALFMGLDAIFTHIIGGEATMYFFFNNTSDNRQTPEQRAAVLAKMAADTEAAQKKLDAELRAKAEEYIAGGRELHLKSMAEFMEYVEAQKKIKVAEVDSNPLVMANNNYFKKLWEYTSFTYRDFTDSIRELQGLNTRTLAHCKQLLRFKAELDEWFSDLEKRKSETRGDFTNDPGFKAIISPNTQARGRNQTQIHGRVNEMVDLFSKRLPLEIYNKFRTGCIALSDESKGNPEYLIHSIATLVKGVTSVYYVAAADDDSDEDVAEDVTEDVPAAPVSEARLARMRHFVEKGRAMGLTDTALGQYVARKHTHYEEQVRDDARREGVAIFGLYGAALDAYVEAELSLAPPPPLTEDDIEPLVAFTNTLVPANGVIAKGLSTLGIFAKRVIGLFSQRGGGKRVNNNILIQACQSFLVNLYLNTLYTNLVNIDSEDNLDYDYYKKLIALIMIYFKKNETQRSRAFILYRILPAHKTIPRILRFLSEQICLESIGCKSKDVKIFSFIKDFHTPAEYNALNEKIDGMTFKPSKKALLTVLEGYFEEVELVKSEAAEEPRRATRKKSRIETPDGSLESMRSAETLRGSLGSSASLTKRLSKHRRASASRSASSRSASSRSASSAAAEVAL